MNIRTTKRNVILGYFGQSIAVDLLFIIVELFTTKRK